MKPADIDILIVEDEPFVAQDIQHKLSTLGYKITGVVDTGLAAIKHAANHQPDLVLMDIVLPGAMDGIQAAAAIRDQHDIPIIYLTAYSGQDFLDRAKITDPMAYIIKPANERDLHAAITIALQKTDNEKQRLEKEWLDATLVSLADALVAWNLEGKIIRVNHALLNLMSLGEQDLIDHDITELIKLSNEADGLRVTEKLIYLIESEDGRKEDWDLILHCQQQIPVSIRGSRILNQHKQCIGYAMLIRDDTERKQQEQRIKESEARFQQLVNHIESIFYLEDIKRKQIIYLSPAYEKVYGRIPPVSSEAYPPLFLKYVHNKDQFKVKELILSINAQKKCTATVRITRPDGEMRWIKIRGYPVHDLQGKVYRMACVIDDVTENTVAEIKLRQAAKVFDNTSEGILITDPELRVVAINQAFSKITGYSEQEILGMTPKILQSGQQPPSFYKSMWQAIKTTGHWQGEVINKRRNGENYPQWMTINTILDAEGEILNYISVFSDITHVKQTQEDFDYLAHHDPLTGFANRLLFNARLEHAIERAVRDQHHVVVMMMDLDRFKDINDSLGHAAGDSLLKLLAERLRACLREEDTLARLGGDEFIFIIEDINHQEEIRSIAQKIQAIFAKPFVLNNREIIVTASLGISLYPQDGTEVATLIRNADIAMYKAKQQGKNCFVFYTEALNIDNINRLLLATEMRQGLERGEFLVYYQPQLCTVNHSIVSAEALIRWQHPEQGFMSALSFIPLAEETGFIEKLGAWVLHTACQQCKQWHDQGYQHLVIAVNLSAKQFLFSDITNTVQTVLHETGLPAQYLELEITESGLMDSGDKVIAALDALKSLGVRLSIDDFGTGYSSLSYLKRFPLDKLKIDQSFVKGLPGDEQDASIARSIIALGKSMNLTVIAEGVENEAQREFMLVEGCDEVQGYLFSRPVSAAEFGEFLQKDDAVKSKI